MNYNCLNPNCLCFIIPNDIIKAIARNSDDNEAKEIALDTLPKNGYIRGQRQSLTDIETETSTPAEDIETVKAKKPKIWVHTADYQDRIPGQLIRKHGQDPVGDDSVDDAYYATQIIIEFFKEVFGINSYNNKGVDIKSTVHYLKKYDNAFWDGRQMVYGDGDGIYFRSFTNCLEITGHEIFHGVIGASAQLRYYSQSGALNESFSDIFGCLVKQWKLNQTVEEADWIIGKGLFTSRVNGVGVRKLDAPGTAYNDKVIGKDVTVGHMKSYYKGSRDNGGVHWNSGIPSLAFVKACNLIGGHSWNQLGMVWFETLITRLKRDSNFKDAVNGTIAVAKSMFGENSDIVDAIKQGWQEVGLINDGNSVK